MCYYRQPKITNMIYIINHDLHKLYQYINQYLIKIELFIFKNI